MKINRPTENQKKALAKFEEPTLELLASYSNNTISLASGKRYCALNGEQIRQDEALKLLSELFDE